MRGEQVADAARGAQLDRVIGGPVTVLVLLAAGWLLICLRTARRRPAGTRVGVSGRSGPTGRVVRTVRAASAFLGAAGLLSQVDAAPAAPAGDPAEAAVTTPVANAAPLGALGGAEGAHGGAEGAHGGADRRSTVDSRVVTLRVVTDSGEKAPSLWPVGREETRGQVVAVPGDRVVVVHRGDSLWSLARRHLGPEVTQAAVEQAVHDWYALNESVIGPDRDLILPGQELHVPGATPHVEVTGGS